MTIQILAVTLPHTSPFTPTLPTFTAMNTLIAGSPIFRQRSLQPFNNVQAMIKELNHPVRMVPVEDFGLKSHNGKTHVVLTDDNLLLQTVGKNYSLSPIGTLLGNVATVLDSAGISYKVRGRCDDKSVFYADFIVDTVTKNVQKNDAVTPMIRLLHSYDGTCSYNLHFGIYRQICSNGLTVPIQQTQVRKRNTVGNIHAIQGLPEYLQEFVNSLDNVVKVYKVLTDRKVENVTERLTEVIEATKVFSVYTDNDKRVNFSRHFNEASATLSTEMAQLGMKVANDWLVYNAVNAALMDRELVKTAEHKQREKDAQVLHFMLAR